MLNLVQNEITGPIKDDGYIYLEFRHNAFNDSPINWVRALFLSSWIV